MTKYKQYRWQGWAARLAGHIDLALVSEDRAALLPHTAAEEEVCDELASNPATTNLDWNP